MSGPNSLPMGDRAEFDRLMSFRCDVHAADCTLDKKHCRPVRWREWLRTRNRLVTGKTR